MDGGSLWSNGISDEKRGPIAYLFALKEDEPAPVRLYALHRMIRAEALTTQPARTAEGFDLDQAIAEGKVDFGQGRLIALELQVRGYLVPLLSVCPLSADQQLEDEPETSAFSLRVSAQVPSTGQLLRWLLGAGDNLEVIALALAALLLWLAVAIERRVHAAACRMPLRPPHRSRHAQAAARQPNYSTAKAGTSISTRSGCMPISHMSVTAESMAASRLTAARSNATYMWP